MNLFSRRAWKRAAYKAAANAGTSKGEDSSPLWIVAGLLLVVAMIASLFK